MASHRLKELDIIRGFATGWVVGLHFWLIHFMRLFKDQYVRANRIKIRVLLLYAIALQVCIVCAVGLRSLTKLTLAQRNRLAVFKL